MCYKRDQKTWKVGSRRSQYTHVPSLLGREWQNLHGISDRKIEQRHHPPNSLRAASETCSLRLVPSTTPFLSHSHSHRWESAAQSCNGLSAEWRNWPYRSIQHASAGDTTLGKLGRQGCPRRIGVLDCSSKVQEISLCSLALHNTLLASCTWALAVSGDWITTGVFTLDMPL